MLYLSQMIGEPVVDAQGERLGTISDLAISTGEVFPRITSLAFQGPGRVPFMISWRKYVDTFDDDGITLSVDAHDIRFSYLQPDEVLLARDLMDRQIVDTQGLKVVRVNDLKLSQSGTQLRLLGAEVGVRGILRGLHPLLEKAVVNVAKLFHKKVDEQLIAWNYMDLLDRDLSEVQLSVTHRRLDELHPADVADILEQLDPQQRANVFQHLDDAQATEAISEMEQLIASLEEHQRHENFAKIKAIVPELSDRYAIGRDYIPKVPEALPVNRTYRYVHKPEDLLRAMTAVLARVDHRLPPPMAAFEGIVGREPYPVADKAGEILERLSRFGVTRFRALFKGNRSRSEVVATFIAVLELCKARRLRLAGTESDCTVTCTEEGGGELELTTDGEKTAD